MRNGIIAIALVALALGDPSIARAQSHDTLPFTVGERLTVIDSNMCARAGAST